METMTPALQKMYVCIDDQCNMVVKIRSVEIEFVQLISSTESLYNSELTKCFGLRISYSRNVLGL